MDELPFITCLCPTYRRPKMLANAIACFLAQDYPKERQRLIVLDDSGELTPEIGEEWSLHSVSTRYPSLPAKFNSLLDRDGRADAVAVWEDDDIYMPWHLSAAARCLMNGSRWSKPSRVGSLYTGSFQTEDATGRFHASLVIGVELLKAVGGWPDTKQGSFDLQLISLLHRQAVPGDPCLQAPPSYVFRWASTGAYHGQAYMTGPRDEGWYDQIPQVTKGPEKFRLGIIPEMDEETKRIYSHHTQ